MQSDPSLAQATQAPKKSNSMMIVVIILVLALIGVGFWGFSQSSTLKATQAKLDTLQGQYDSLTAEKNQLSSDFNATKTELETTKADLEKTKGELATTQDDLKKAQDQASSLQAKIDKASKISEILYAFSTVKSGTDILTIDAKVKAANNKELQTEWGKFASAPTAESSANFLLYLISAIGNALK